MFGRPRKTALLLVRTTLPSRAQAEALAQRLVDARLAACVHVSEVASVYRWKGQRLHETEQVVEARTSGALLDNVRAAILDRHPYEIPLVEAWAMQGVPAAYAAWARDQLA
jgi:periplasmic divalent cation tolerance protein